MSPKFSYLIRYIAVAILAFCLGVWVHTTGIFGELRIKLKGSLSQPHDTTNSEELSKLDFSNYLYSYGRVQYEEINQYLMDLHKKSDAAREKFWHRDFSSISAYLKSVETQRQSFSELFQLNLRKKVELNPHLFAARSTDEGKYKLFQVVFQSEPGIHVYGLLAIPGEIDRESQDKHAAIVCLHGFGGSPEVVFGLEEGPPGYTHVHKKIAKQMAERGYVVFAPYLIHPTEPRKELDMKAIPFGQRLVGIELWKVLRSVDFLCSLPQVDEKRIGMLGFSLGGMYALWVSALDSRIVVSVVSGYFSDRAKKMVLSSENYPSPIGTGQIWSYLQGSLNQFSDADIGSLAIPRSLLIEQGKYDHHHDIRDTRQEFSILRSYFERLGLGERIGFHAFEGGHEIGGERSIDFMYRRLGKGQH